MAALRRDLSAERYLALRARFGIKAGLDTISALLEAMGHPESRFPSLLVAGTNGKGSVAAYVDSVFRASGLRSGRFTSPHLVRVNERIAVGGSPISDRNLEEAVGEVRRSAERLVMSGRLKSHPTYFEVTTAAALAHFAHERVDAAVLEVGLGGRLDATNAAPATVSAIVTIERDHEEHLGTTLDSIAREKAGVLRPGRETVLGPMSSEAREAIAAEATRVGAQLVDAEADAVVEPSGEAISIRTPDAAYGPMRPLAGAHQRTNALVAVRLVERARSAGIGVDLRRVGDGISATSWPGRLQWVPGRPPLLLDGAHNPSGARALAAHLAGVGPYVLLLGIMSDKDLRGVAEPLVARAREVVLTRPRIRRAADPEQIAAALGPALRHAHCQIGVRRALAIARRLSGGSVPVVVAGSLYLVGEVLGILEGRPARQGA
jgi:dihydrofolate synthase/folylpolyglutamate synthase